MHFAIVYSAPFNIFCYIFVVFLGGGGGGGGSSDLFLFFIFSSKTI